MSVAKVYNPATSQWEPVVVGKQGPKGDPGIITSATPPDDTSVIWADTTTEEGAIAIPAGGSTGQVLAKSSGTDYATSWELRAPTFVKAPASGWTIAPQTSGGVITPTLNELRLAAFVIHEEFTVDAIGVEVRSNGGVGALFRLGLYRSTGSDPSMPDTLVFDAGTVSSQSQGNKWITGLSSVLTPGIYWTAVVAQGVVANISGGGTTVDWLGVSYRNATTANAPNFGANTGWTLASVSGALPSTIAPSRSTASIPVAGVRRA